MSEFIFSPNKSYMWTCTIHSAGDRRAEKLKIDLRFKRLGQQDVEDLARDLEMHAVYLMWKERQAVLPEDRRELEYQGEKGITPREMLHRVVEGWGVVKDGVGEKLEFSHDLLDQILDSYTGSTKDLVNDYFTSVKAGRQGN